MATDTDTPPTAPSLGGGVRLQLSAMMFLQFAVWGAWFLVFFPYLIHLKFDGLQAGALIGNMALGAIVSSLFAGFIADRLVDARFIMAACHLGGAGLLYAIAQVTSPDDYWQLYALTLAYAMLYNPTLVLANAITFRHVPDGGRDFPGIRVFGTVGWIAAGLFVDKVLPSTGLMEAGTLSSTSSAPLLVSAALSALLGLFCLTLPKTPPTGAAGDGLPIARAFGLFRNPSFAVFFTVSLAITVVLAFYYTVTGDFLTQRVGVTQVPTTMAIGQVCELIFLPLLPFFLLYFGMKWVLAAGMLCWGLRYLCFSQAGESGLPFALAISGIALHGLCFDFFFAAGFIYCDNEAPRDIRASAQALFSFLTYGVGMWLGSLACGALRDYYTTPVEGGVGVVDWQSFWLVPSVGVLACLAVFVTLFRTRRAPEIARPAAGGGLGAPLGVAAEPGV